MPIAFLVGPAAALLGIVVVIFVMRRKSVEKRSMYSARRSQIEHKVRAARQRTLAPGSRAEKPPEAPPVPGSSIYAPAPSAPQVTYEASAFEAPPAAALPEVAPPPPMPQGPPSWDAGPTTPAPFSAPPQTVPGQYPTSPPSAGEPAYAPPAEPAFSPQPTEPGWTPAPSEPATPLEPAEPAVAAASPSSWSVVTESKEPAEGEPSEKRDKKAKKGGSAWQLASGEAPGSEEAEMAKPSSSAVAIAQYAVLVVGLVMVLIGVFVMIANSHVT